MTSASADTNIYVSAFQFGGQPRRFIELASDRGDNRILECASAAQRDFIGSGDGRHVLPVGNYAGIRIVTVSVFLELLGNTQL